MVFARIAIVASILLAVGCESSHSPILESRESEQYSFTTFMEGIPKFPYVADEQKLSRVKIGFGHLAPELTRDEVKKLLGEPDAEMIQYKVSGSERELIYTTWAYYLKRLERERAKQDFDRVIVLYFKPNGHLYWADADNVPGLKSIGGPTLYPEGAVRIQQRR